MLDLAILIRLMRHLQNPRPVRDALFDARDPGEVFLIVGAGACDQRRLAANRFANNVAHGFHKMRVNRGHRRINGQKILQFILKFRVLLTQLLD